MVISQLLESKVGVLIMMFEVGLRLLTIEILMKSCTNTASMWTT